MGDSIRMNYTPLVSDLLKNEAEIVQITTENGEHTKKTKKKLKKWLKQVKGQSLDYIHFNNGLHDLSWSIKKKKSKVPIEEYETNLKDLLALFHKYTSAKIFFASTTPILTERHKITNPTHLVREDLHQQYNQCARKIMAENHIPIDDLESIIINAGVEKCLLPDGVHMTEEGNQLLANQVATFLREQISQ